MRSVSQIIEDRSENLHVHYIKTYHAVYHHRARPSKSHTENGRLSQLGWVVREYWLPLQIHTTLSGGTRIL